MDVVNHHNVFQQSGSLSDLYYCINCGLVKTDLKSFSSICIYYLIINGKSDREIAFELDIDDDEVHYFRMNNRWRL